MISAGRITLVAVALAAALAGLVSAGGLMNLPDGPEIPPVEKKCALWDKYSQNHNGEEDYLKAWDCQECCLEVIVEGALGESPLGQEIRDGACFCRVEGERPKKRAGQ